MRYSSHVLALELEKLAYKRLAALGLGGHEQGVFDEPLVVHSFLSVFFVVEQFTVVDDPCADEYLDLVPPDIGQNDGNDSDIHQVSKEAGEKQRLLSALWVYNQSLTLNLHYFLLRLALKLLNLL